MKTIVGKVLPVLTSVFYNLHGMDNAYVVSDNQKTYVDFSQISVIPEGMFVQLGNSWMAIDAINHDSFGYFFSVPSNEWSTTWTCPICKFENGLLSMECEICGYRVGG